MYLATLKSVRYVLKLLMCNGTCAMKHRVYRLNCLLCEGSQDFYEGETDRPAHNRFMEHTRAGNNPASYSSNGIGKHYAMYHPTGYA